MSTEQERAAFEAPRVTGAPDEIWLCYGDIAHDDTHAECCRQGEVTWCEGKQGPADVKYVRAALAAAPVQAVPEAELEALRKDAERYRRLRDGQNWPAVFGGHDEPEPLRGAHLDAAIDAKLALHNAKVCGP